MASVQHWSPGRQIVVFNLGLKRGQLDEVSRWLDVKLRWAPSGPPIDHRVDGNLRRLRHVRVLRQYAWKPVAICEALDEFGALLYLDSGGDVRGSLDPVEARLHRDGHFLAQGQDLDMTTFLHNAVYRNMDLAKSDFVGKPSFAGNTQGYVPGSLAVRLILRPMRLAALDKRCNGPFGATRWNHRFDQSLLSLIAYRCGLDIEPQTRFLCSDRSELPADPLEPASEQVIHLARRSSQEYRALLKLR